MREQSRVMSRDTGAKDINGAAIRRNIGQDGSGMGFAVVDAVAKFANAVQMNMSTRLALLPDDPGLVLASNRRYIFTSRAVAAPVGTSNGCGAPVDTNGDGMLDMHPACGPGATPRFEVTVVNPAKGNPGEGGVCIGGPTPGVGCAGGCGTNGICSPPYPRNVPLNPSRPGGGYLMTLQLVGRDTLSTTSSPQIVDEIPVLIIPQDVLPNPNTVFATSASYEQVVNAQGCGAREVPTWRRIYWTDTLPVGTKVEWEVCSRDTDAELAACGAADFVQIARVEPQGTCTTSAQCTNAYCNNPTLVANAGRCESAIGGSCLVAADCGSGAQCVGSQCYYVSSPGLAGLDLKVAAGRVGNRQRMRVRAKLYSSANASLAPTIHSYRLDYDCTQDQ